MPEARPYDGVGQCDGLVLGVEGLDGEDRAEDLLLDHAGVVRQAREDRGLVVVAAVQVEPLAAARDAGALLAGQFDVLLDLPEVPLPRHRSHDGLGGAGVADRDAGNGVGEDVQQGAVHRACHQQPRATHAELPGVEDESLDDRADRLLQVGVLEDDVGGVAADSMVTGLSASPATLAA